MFLFFKQKTAYEMRISDWSSDVCSSDLGYDALSALNPKLIYCAISGFGMTGPLRDRPSFDIVVQALSGAMSVNGEPGAMPAKLGLPMGDLVGGIFGPIGILGALYERQIGRAPGRERVCQSG